MPPIKNKELLEEIAKSKASYCTFTKPEYASYDVIVGALSDAKPGQVVRLMTWDHIPLEPFAKGRNRSKNKLNVKVNFPPFKHYLITDTGAEEVGRSHWTGDFDTGHFTTTKGKLTNRLAILLMACCERMGRRANWRHYTYVDEMQAYAIQHLCDVALNFDEALGDNPHAYYWRCITNAYTKIFNAEKKQQTIRDDILWSEGAAPSTSRQVEWECKRIGLIEPPVIKRGPGRPKKVAA